MYNKYAIHHSKWQHKITKTPAGETWINISKRKYWERERMELLILLNI